MRVNPTAKLYDMCKILRYNFQIKCMAVIGCDVLLTVHLSIILVVNQLNAQVLVL